jgi:hypothetical protein
MWLLAISTSRRNSARSAFDLKVRCEHLTAYCSEGRVLTETAYTSEKEPEPSLPSQMKWSSYWKPSREPAGAAKEADRRLGFVAST